MNKAIAIAVPLTAIIAVLALTYKESEPVVDSNPPQESESDILVKYDKPGGNRETMQRLLSGESRKLTSLQIERFLESRDHDAPSLLAAWQLTGDDFWLEKAAADYPEDPRVAVAMLSRDGALAGIDWIERLKTNDPENGAVSLFGALADFNLGDVDSALNELTNLNSLPEANFYTRSMAETLVEAYEHAGHGQLEAELTGAFQVSMPFTAPMTELNRAIASTINSAFEAGDETLAKALGEAGIATASRMSGESENKFLISQLVTVSMERNILQQMNEFDLVHGDSKIVAERLAELDTRVAGIATLIKRSQDALEAMSDTDAGKYSRMLRKEGEEKALQWLVTKAERM